MLVSCDLAKSRRRLNLPDYIRPRGIEQLDQSPPTCPVPIGEEEGNHTRHEIPTNAKTVISYTQTRRG